MSSRIVRVYKKKRIDVEVFYNVSGGPFGIEDAVGTGDPVHDPIWKTICVSRVGISTAGRWIQDVAGASDHEQQERSQEPYQGTTVSRRAVPILGLHLWPFSCCPC